MTQPNNANPTTRQDRDITETVLLESKRLGNFIRRRVSNASEAEDILQDVFYELIEAYRLSEPIGQVGAWLFRVARSRIIDRFRKKKEQSIDAAGDAGDSDPDYRLDLALPAPDAGPDALYARSVLLAQLQQALDALPQAQREVFVAHELEGVGFKEMAAQSGIPVNTLLARKRYAVLALRTRLQPVYDDFDTDEFAT